MNEYFIDSKQPLFFSFNQIVKNHKNDLDFNLITKNFQENYETKQQENWLKYWNKQGKKQVLNSWNEKYKYYLEVEEEPSDTENFPDSNEEQHEVNEILEVSDVVIPAQKSWEDLWQEHSEQIYYEQYIIFTTIYYNYFIHLKNSCESPATSVDNEEDNEGEECRKGIQSDCDSLRQELEQLAILGLPTSFGSKPQNSSNNHKSVKHHSIFLSDSETDNEITESDMENCKKASLHTVQKKSKSKVQKKKRNRKLKNVVPSFILEDKSLLKYWRKRFSLFSRFDEGIRLDRESWFSVTPEKVAEHLAERLKCSTIVDGFCGSGGNAIQFALTCDKVIAIDIDPIKLEMAKHNAKIYNVSHKIEFILCDFLHLAASCKLKADVVFLSPPWGGPKYKNKQHFDIEKHLLPVKASKLVEASRNISQNIALFLPRKSIVKQIIQIAGTGNRCEIEHNYLDSRLVAITALYGEEILTSKTND